MSDATALARQVPYPLKPVEALLRDRELRGYGVCEECRAAVARAMERPNPCRVVLWGPDALLLPTFPPAIDFLREEVGFLFEDELEDFATEPRPGDDDDDGAGCEEGTAGIIATAAPPAEPLAATGCGQLQGGLQPSEPAAAASGSDSAAAAEPSSASTEGAPLPSLSRRQSGRRSNCSSCTPSRFEGRILCLGVVYDEASADWRLFQRRCQQALRLLDWAMRGSSACVTVRLHSLCMYDPRELAAPFRIDFSAEWTDELGHPQTQVFPTTAYYDPSDAIVVVGSAVQPPTRPPAAASAAAANAASEAAMAAAAVAKSPGAPSTALRFNGLVEVYPTRCEMPCHIHADIYRRRALSDKHIGRLTAFYDNSCPMRVECDVHSPDNKYGLPVGRMTVEADSLVLRCWANDAFVATALRNRAGAKQPEGAHSVPRGDARNGGAAKLATPQQPKDSTGFVAHVARPPDDRGIKYDADDYFDAPV